MNVAHVPGLSHHLLSLRHIADAGNKYIGTRKGIRIVFAKSGDELFAPSCGYLNGLFGYRTDRFSEENVHAVIAPGARPTPPSAADINEFHCSHGHMHEDLLRKTAKQIGVKLRGQLVPCQGCSETKGIRKPVKPFPYTRATKPAERCFADLSGPKSVKSMGGKKYMMIVRDDYSRFTRVFFLRTKDETATYFSKYLAEIAPRKVEVVRSDGGGEFSKGAFGALCTTEKIRQEFTTEDSQQYNGVVERQIAIIEAAGLAARIQAAAKYPNEVFPRGESLRVEQAHWACRALNCTATLANPGYKSPHEIWFGSPPSSSPFPFLKPGFRSVKRRNKLQPKAVRCWYLGPAPNYPRDAMRILSKSGRVVATRHVTWAHLPTHIPFTPQQAILAPRKNFSDGDESREGQAPSAAVKSRPTSSEDDGSGGEGHSGDDSTDNVFLYDGVDVRDGLDDLDDTPQKTDERRKRYQRKLRAFNTKRINRQGSVVETNSGRVSNAPSRGGEGNSSLRSRTGGGGSSGSDSASNTVGSGNESAPTSISSQDGGEGTGGGREGESASPSHAPSYSTSTPDSGEGVAQPVLSGRDRRNLEWMEGLPELTAGRTRGETRADALLAKLESVREEMYAFNVASASSPGELEFGFRSPIGLHVGQTESIPPNWADIQKSEFYEEWLNAMKLELDGHIEIGMFLADVVPKGVNVITAKWVFAWKTDSDGYITKAKARLVARGFGQELGVDYFDTFAPTPTVSSIKVTLAIAVQNDWPLYHFDVKQAFVQAKLDTDVYMKLPYGCGERTGKVVKLDRALYGIKQAGRQWSAVLCQTLVDEHGMEQCRCC